MNFHPYAANVKLWIHHLYPLDPNPKDVCHADFILKSPGYREGRMKGQCVICFTNRMVHLNGNILKDFILHHNEPGVAACK